MREDGLGVIDVAKRGAASRLVSRDLPANSSMARPPCEEVAVENRVPVHVDGSCDLRERRVRSGQLC